MRWRHGNLTSLSAEQDGLAKKLAEKHLQVEWSLLSGGQGRSKVIQPIIPSQSLKVETPEH